MDKQAGALKFNLRVSKSPLRKTHRAARHWLIAAGSEFLVIFGADGCAESARVFLLRGTRGQRREENASICLPEASFKRLVHIGNWHFTRLPLGTVQMVRRHTSRMETCFSSCFFFLCLEILNSLHPQTKSWIDSQQVRNPCPFVA